jgi:hypothetical protein
VKALLRDHQQGRAIAGIAPSNQGRMGKSGGEKSLEGYFRLDKRYHFEQKGEPKDSSKVKEWTIMWAAVVAFEPAGD